MTKGGSAEDSSQYYCDKVGGRGSGAVAKAGPSQPGFPCGAASRAVKWLGLKGIRLSPITGERSNVIDDFLTFSRTMVMAT